MPDYGHALRFGTFLTPSSQDPAGVVELALLSERAGLDLVTFQDHPYQPAFLDAWTLMSWVAARTRTITVAPNVANLPLRPPAVLARSAASLDILSGGRFELGLGAGGFWDAIEAMGGRRLSPGAAVSAVEEAIAVIRALWDTGPRGGVRINGRYYPVSGAKRGPAPAHDVSIWLGAYKPKMLALVGRRADGWLPSLGYLQPGDLAKGNRLVDEAAEEAGRDPAAVRRLLNVSGAFSSDDDGFLRGPARQWVEQLAGLALTDGVSTFIVMGDDADTIQRFGHDVAPAVRELVAAERSQLAGHQTQPAVAGGEQTESPEGHQDRLGLRPTPDPGVRLAAAQPWDESTRPRRSAGAGERAYSERGRAVGRHLIDVHDHLRSELASVRDVLDQVRSGAVDAAAARSHIADLTVRQNDWTLGAYCAAYCRVVGQHHKLEDEAVFPHLRRADRELGPVLDRLGEEHQVIHEVLELLDERLVEFIAEPEDFTGLQDAVDLLTDALLSHLSYEEEQLVEPLTRLGFYPNQV